ncbi:MAG: hypothetical protein AAF585_06065 [Verrucomicrobiota bacterium]
MPDSRPDADLFDALRYSESEGASLVDPPKPKPAESTSSPVNNPVSTPNIQLKEDDPPLEPDELIVELPEVFERPHSPTVDQYEVSDVMTRHRIEEGPPPSPTPHREGMGIGSVVSVVFLTNVLIATIALTAAYFYPQKSATLLRQAAEKLDATPEIVETEENLESVKLVEQRFEVLDLEDRAVSEHDRNAYAELMQLTTDLEEGDPILAAARASVQRIEHYYASEPLGPPAALDSQAIYGAETEADLPQTIVIQVLRDDRQTPEARRRAAWLLGSNNSSPSKKALVNTIRNDDNLSVVLQAFDSFRTLTGYPSQDAFDARSVELWWARTEAAALGQNGPPAAADDRLRIGPEE